MKEVTAIMNRDEFEFVMPEEIAAKLFGGAPGNEEAARAKAEFFGNLNRTLREHCIVTSEQIAMTRRYGLIPALLSFWRDFRLTLGQLAHQIAQIFEKNKSDANLPYGAIGHQVQCQILNFGHQSWKRYILKQRFIEEELLSDIRLISERPESYPFQCVNVAKKVLEMLSVLPEKEFRPLDYRIARVVADYLKLFLKHKFLYPESVTGILSDCALIADSLFVYMKYCPSEFVNAKAWLVEKMKLIESDLATFKQLQPPDNFSLFDNFEYIQLMKMMRICDPEGYVQQYIPTQIAHMSEVGRRVRPRKAGNDLMFYKLILPMFESATAIIKDDERTLISFCKEFCNKMLPLEVLGEASEFFGPEKRQYLPCIWQMTSKLPRYVMVLSNGFISYFNAKLQMLVRRRIEDDLQELVAEINWLVGCQFNNHPSMVLARSALFIPHQRDRELIGRARCLIEQAHNPSRMNYAVAELFDIVPFVKDKRDLFTGIASFLQNQLLAQVEPSVELEQALVDSMGQYTEAEYISPLQVMLREFADRYSLFEQIAKLEGRSAFPPGIRIAVLPNVHWKRIVQRGILFHDYDDARRKFEERFCSLRKSSQLIWCDPSSVLEVQIVVEGRPLLFLFNGVQYMIMRRIVQGPVVLNDLLKDMTVDDLHEQLTTLVESGLLEVSEDKTTYKFTSHYDQSLYRNFARKYKSAANIALMEMKEEARKKAIDSMIVQVVKQAQAPGIKMQELISQVQTRAIKYFSVTPELIRERTRYLERTKYIKQGDARDRFVYCPE